MNDDLGTSALKAGGVAFVDGARWAALWFARDPVARLVVTRDLTVLSLNHRASSLLQKSVVITIRDGLLFSRERGVAAELAETIAASVAVPQFRALCADTGSLLVEAVALDGDSRGPVGLAIRDLAGPVEIDCADLEPMFAVTPGEQLVIVELLKGRSSREIAEASGKSVLTIRTHVKRAYGKIGVKTRGQLFARLLPYLSIR